MYKVNSLNRTINVFTGVLDDHSSNMLYICNHYVIISKHQDIIRPNPDDDRHGDSVINIIEPYIKHHFKP